jgi:hypothetical protein
MANYREKWLHQKHCVKPLNSKTLMPLKTPNFILWAYRWAVGFIPTSIALYSAGQLVKADM